MTKLDEKALEAATTELRRHLLSAAQSPHETRYAAILAPAITAYMDALPAGSGLVERLRAHLREHWLANIACDHEAKTDTANCSCSMWRDEPHPSVGGAVDAWIEHVFSTLPADALSLTGQGGTVPFDKAAFLMSDESLPSRVASPIAEGTVSVPQSALDWLFGEKPDADGNWFGEVEDEVKPLQSIQGRRPRYWWRSHFRKLIAAAPAKKGGEA